MKKLAALSLAIALILSLAGCAAQAKTFDIGKASKLVITCLLYTSPSPRDCS